MTETLESRQRRPAWPALLAGLLHLAVLPFYAASGLLAPQWAVAVLLVAWVAGAAAVVALRRRGLVVVLVPAAAVALWFLVLTAGERMLGWTA